METKEVLAGFEVLEADDLDEAIEVASRNPIASAGSVELRPIAEELAQAVTEALSAASWRQAAHDGRRSPRGGRAGLPRGVRDRPGRAQSACSAAELARYQPTPVVRLNRGVAIAMAEGPRHGLTFIDELAGGGELDGYHLFHAARADLLRRLGRDEDAAKAYERALELVTNDVERSFLARRLRQVRA